MSASLHRLAARQAAGVLAVGSVLAFGAHPTLAQATYTDMANGTVTFSTAFSPAIPAGGTTTADTLVFSNTAASTQTDDLTQALNANVLTFNNTAALVLNKGAGTTIALGGANPTVNLNGSSTPTIALNLALDADTTFASTTGGQAQISGVISGAGGLTANTSLNLSGVNTYSGGTTIASGRFVQLNGAGATVGTGAVSDGGTLFLSFAGLSVGNNISGAGGVSLFNNATLGGANTYSGATSVGAHSLTIANAAALSVNSAYSVASGGQLNLQPNDGVNATYNPLSVALTGTGDLRFGGNTHTTVFSAPITLASGGHIDEYGINNYVTISGAIGGSGPLQITGAGAGAGSITLSGANTYTGNTSLIGSNQTFTLNLKGGTNRLSTGGLTFTSSTGGVMTTLDLNGQTQSISTLTANGNGTDVLQSTGGVGTLHVTSGAQPSINLVNLTQNNVNIDTPGFVQENSGTYTLNSGSIGIGSEFLNSYTASGNFTQNGGTVDAFQSRVANAGTGTYNLNGGTFLTDLLHDTGGTGIVNFNGGTLGVSTRNAGFAASDFFHNVTHAYILNGGAKIDTTNGSVGMSQVLEEGASSTGGLTKLGANTLTLKGANTYTGGTTVTGGTLALDASAADGSGALTIGADGTVTVMANDALGAGQANLDGGTLSNGSPAAAKVDNTQSTGLLSLLTGTASTLDFGAANSGAVFTFSGLDANNSGLLMVQNWLGTPNVGGGMDQLFIDTALSSTQLAQITFSGVAATQIIGGANNFEVVPAPEPSQAAALGLGVLGLAGLVFAARKRSRPTDAR